jgi:hypothetical protein
MLTILVVVIALGALAIFMGHRSSSRAVFGVGVMVIAYVVSWVVWTLLLMLGLVPVDPVSSRLQVYRLDPPWNTLLFLAPPVIPALVCAWFSGRWMSGR